MLTDDSISKYFFLCMKKKRVQNTFASLNIIITLILLKVVPFCKYDFLHISPEGKTGFIKLTFFISFLFLKNLLNSVGNGISSRSSRPVNCWWSGRQGSTLLLLYVPFANVCTVCELQNIFFLSVSSIIKTTTLFHVLHIIKHNHHHQTLKLYLTFTFTWIGKRCLRPGFVLIDDIIAVCIARGLISWWWSYWIEERTIRWLKGKHFGCYTGKYIPLIYNHVPSC